MPQIQKNSRMQMQVVAWEEFIAADNEVRVIDLFVDLLDLEKLGFIVKGQSHEGRPAYDTGGLLKLYLYGYFNRIRSSRQLEKAAQRNVELFWLIDEMKPCYVTIANFRKENTKSLERTFKTFNNFLKGQDLLNADTAAVDGTKIAAQNSKKNNYNEKKIKQHLDYIDKQTDSYLKQLEEVDQQNDSETEQQIEIAQKLDHLTQRRQKYEGLKDQLESVRANHQAQISTTDPDARALPKKMNIVEMSYNVQTAVEANHKLITNFEVTNQNDTYALSSMAMEAKNILEKERLKVLADKGYDTGAELKKCTENNIETYVAPRKRKYAKKDPRFGKEKFFYEHDTNTYTCPQGKQLTTNGSWYNKYSGKDKQYRKSYLFQRFSASFKICNQCPFKETCVGQTNLKKSKGRQIERSEYQDYVEENQERIRSNKPLYRLRQQIVEHPFGTIKRSWGYSYTLLRGKEKVSAEMALIFTCYNLRRSISIWGVKDLLDRLGKSVFAFLGAKWIVLNNYEAFLHKNITLPFFNFLNISLLR